MRYSPMQQVQVRSPMTGDSRVGGGGAVTGGKKGEGTSGGFMRSPSGSLQMGGQEPQMGTLAPSRGGKK